VLLLTGAVVAVLWDVLAAWTQAANDTISHLIAEPTADGWWCIPWLYGALGGHLFATAHLGHDNVRLATFFAVAAVVVLVNVLAMRLDTSGRLVLEVHPLLWLGFGQFFGALLWSMRQV
jgi:hypothetical protein